MRFLVFFLLLLANDCFSQLCTGSLGDPVVNIHFGSGANPGQQLSAIVPGASTTYPYIPVVGNPATPIVYDGQYTITNNVISHPAWFSGALDHTPNDVNGFMAFFNASEAPGEFYKQTVNGLCANIRYEFASWVANVLDPSVLVGIKPDITFVVQKTDGTPIASYVTGPINQQSSMTWVQFGFFFSTPVGVNSVVLKMINTNVGGAAQPGNDFAIDDITFRPCGPSLASSFSPTLSQITKTQCGFAPVPLYGTASSGYSSPSYLWQMSTNSGVNWTDLGLSNNLNYSYTPTSNGTFLLRMLSGEGTNINSASCRVTSNFITLTITAPPQISFTGNTICPGAQGQLQYQITNGISPFSISYDNGIGTVNQNNLVANGTINVSPNPASTTVYTMISVKDAAGCTRNSNFTIPTATITVQPLSIAMSPSSAAICSGDSIQLNASGGLQYSWSPAIGLSNPSASSPKASPAVTTTYKVVVSGNGGCKDSLTTTISVDAKPILVISAPVNVCAKDSTQISASGASTYLWAPSTGLSNPNIPNPFAIISSTISYTVTGSSVNGCTVSKSVTVNALPKPNVLSNADTSLCGNGNLQLQATGAQQYQWKPSTGLSDPFISNPVAIINSTITYIVEGTAANGCKAFDTTVVNLFSKPVVTISKDTGLCRGISFPLIAGGAQQYQWSPVAGLSASNLSNPFANIDTSIIYTVTGTSANGCSATNSVRLTAMPKPILAKSADTTICQTGVVNLFASGAQQYLWSPSTGLDNPAIATPVASPLATTKYYLKGTGSNGCVTSDSIQVTVKPKPAFSVTPLNGSVCGIKNVQLSGFGGDSYLWQPAASLSNPNISNPIASPISTTTYSVLIKDSFCKMDSTFNIPITLNPTPVITVNKDNDITCNQPSSQLKASGASTYNWYPSAGLNNANVANPIATINATVTYHVEGISDKGCVGKDSITVHYFNSGDLSSLQMPSAFTPNGDGKNDCFGIRKWGNVEVQNFRVYNRWGEVVFTGKTSYDCWNGKYKEVEQPSGAFVYVVKVRTACGEVERKGTVILIR